MNKTFKAALFLLLGTAGIAHAQSVETQADSARLAAQETAHPYDSIMNEVAELKSHLNVLETERMQESIWKRKKYLKLGLMFPTVKYAEGEGDLSWKTEMAFMIQKGKTAYLHAKPIAGMVKIGIDWGLICFNYEKLKPKGLAEEISFAPSDDYYPDEDEYEDFTLNLGMHKFEWAPHVGPSVSVNPWKHLIAAGYFHLVPTSSFILENDNFSSGFGLGMAIGASVAYKCLSLGFEWSWNTIKYTQSSFDGVSYPDDEDVEWAGVDGMFSTEKFKLKTSCPRIYLSLRW